MHRVDCHVLTLPDSNPAWLDECLRSLRDQECNVHVVPGVVGHIGKGRAAGFAAGDAEYVTFSDPDDWVEPGAMKACASLLDRTPAAVGVCTEEYVAREGAPRRVKWRPGPIPALLNAANYGQAHHLVVLRRHCLESRLLQAIADEPHFPEYVLLREMSARHSLLWLPLPLYTWRIHAAQFHRRADKRRLWNIVKGE